MKKSKKKFKPFLPYVKAETVDEYFSLPKKEREKWGIYLNPFSLPSEFFPNFKGEKGWATFSREIRKRYPIQGWIREWLFTYDNPTYAFIDRLITKIKELKYAVKTFFNPACPRYRKVFPRHKRIDICDLIVNINSALILDFWHEEVNSGIVNWNGSKEHKKFYNWIKNSVKWIETDKEILLKEIDSLYEKALDVNDRNMKSDFYNQIEKIESKIRDKDTKILVEMIKCRGFFWT